MAVVLCCFSFHLLPFSLDVPVSAQTPTFRTGTTLVEFTIVALDDEGNPVTDLTKEDLVLTDGDRVRDIAFFRFDGNAPVVSHSTPPALPPGFVTNRPAAERNVVAMVLDLININVMDENEKHNQGTVRNQILHHLNRLPPNTHVGLFRFSEIHPIEALQTFTDDLALVRRKVQDFPLATRREFETPTARQSRVGGSDNNAAMAAADARAVALVNDQLRGLRRAKTLASLEALGSHMAGIPGRKSLVWISDGIPMVDPGSQNSYGHHVRESAQRLASQGISLYPVMAAGLPPGRRDDNAEIGTFSVFADATGGRVVTNNNDLTLGVTLAANDQRATYTIGFYASDDQRDEWQRLRVDVKRPGVTLRHRQGYLAVRRALAQPWPAKTWNDVANQPLDSTAIRLNARADVAGAEVTLSLQVAAGDLYFHEKDGTIVADLEIGVVEKTAAGPTNVRARPIEVTLRGAIQKDPGELVPLKTTWAINPKTRALRVIVRDRFTGKYGTVDMPLGGMP